MGINHEIIGFYKKLLGTKSELNSIHARMVRQGSQVSRPEALSLVRNVSFEEIDKAMMCINDDKSPSIDGYNAKFFKKCWYIVKDDIYGDVLDLFR